MFQLKKQKIPKETSTMSDQQVLATNTIPSTRKLSLSEAERFYGCKISRVTEQTFHLSQHPLAPNENFIFVVDQSVILASDGSFINPLKFSKYRGLAESVELSLPETTEWIFGSFINLKGKTYFQVGNPLSMHAQELHNFVALGKVNQDPSTAFAGRSSLFPHSKHFECLYCEAIKDSRMSDDGATEWYFIMDMQFFSNKYDKLFDGVCPQDQQETYEQAENEATLRRLCTYYEIWHRQFGGMTERESQGIWDYLRRCDAINAEMMTWSPYMRGLGTSLKNLGSSHSSST